MEEKEKDKKCTHGFSRRKFIKSAGIVTGGAALVAGSAFASSGLIKQRVAACTETTSQFIGEMVCTACGEKTRHPRGVPAREIKCPQCESAMTRFVDQADC